MSASLTFAAGRELELARIVRESLQLVDGDRVSIESTGNELILRRGEPVTAPPADQPLGRGLIRENGLLVYDSGADIGEGDILRWIDDDRERRAKYVSGIVDEP